MKRIGIIAIALATLASPAYAQTAPKRMGSGAQAGTYSNDSFAWGIGLGALVVLGAVVGVTVAAATGNSN